MLTNKNVKATLTMAMAFEQPDGSTRTIEAGTEIAVGVLPAGEMTGTDLDTSEVTDETLVGYHDGECFFISPEQFTRETAAA